LFKDLKRNKNHNEWADNNSWGWNGDKKENHMNALELKSTIIIIKAQQIGLVT
jgi:hypothetical protein